MAFYSYEICLKVMEIKQETDNPENETRDVLKCLNKVQSLPLLIIYPLYLL